MKTGAHPLWRLVPLTQRAHVLVLHLMLFAAVLLAATWLVPTVSANGRPWGKERSLPSAVEPMPAATFHNPILNSGADPSIVYKDGYYYYTHTTGRNVTVWKSETIAGLSRAQPVVVWAPPRSGAMCCNIWAPELYFSAENGRWYIYFSADDGKSYNNHRMFVLESNTSDAQGAYTEKGRIYDRANDRYAIDGAVLENEDGTIYFVWSGKEKSDTERTQRIYIAPMGNPWTLSGPRVLISSPKYHWEKSVAPINEGPQPITRNGRYSILYAANASWTDEYSQGLLTNVDGNLLNPGSWSKKASPLFAKTDEVFGPGHGSLTRSPDGTQDWFIYHAARSRGSGWDRNIRAQQITWNGDDTPNLGTPVPAGLSHPLPSGEHLVQRVAQAPEDS